MRWFLVLSLPLVLRAPGSAQTVWYVSSICDDTGRGTQADPFCTPQEAVDVAASGDTVILGPGIYRQDVVVPGIELTLRASHGPEQTELLGSQGAALELLPGAKLLLVDLTVSRPTQALPGLVSRKASLTVEGCRFLGTQGIVEGGAILAEDSELVVRTSSFLDTFAYRGGAISSLRGRARIETCYFSGTSAFEGGAIRSRDGALYLSECLFLETVASIGSSVHAESGTLRIDDCRFMRTGSTLFEFQDASSLWLRSVDALIAHSSFEECEAFRLASALRIEGGSLVLSSCSFRNNFVSDAASTLAILDASAEVSTCDFLDNEASAGWGGALYVSVGADHQVRVRDCLFARNSADEGGAVCIRRGFAELVRCRFSANITRGGPYFERGHGGGIFVGGFPGDPPGLASARLQRCVLDKNRALGNYVQLTGGRGGGAFGPLEAWNCTFYANSVGGQGKAAGGAAGGGAQLRNCIAWQDSPEALEGMTIAAWSDVHGSWPGEGNFSAYPRFRDVDAGDFRLLPGSPCIDSGDPLQLDEDGTRIDVGAIAFEPIPSGLVRRK